jgi:hypothetical protein
MKCVVGEVRFAIFLDIFYVMFLALGTVVRIREQFDGVEIEYEWFENLAIGGEAKAHGSFPRRHSLGSKRRSSVFICLWR